MVLVIFNNYVIVRKLWTRANGGHSSAGAATQGEHFHITAVPL